MPNYSRSTEKKPPLFQRRLSVEPLFILCVALLVSGFYIFAEDPARVPGESPAGEGAYALVQGETPVAGEDQSPVPEQGETSVAGEDQFPVPEQSESVVGEDQAPVSIQGETTAGDEQSPVPAQGETPVAGEDQSPVPEQGESIADGDDQSPAPEQGESAVADGNAQANGAAADSGERGERPDGEEAPKAEEAEEKQEPGPDPAFSPLIARLHADGFPLDETRALFARLGPKAYTPAYMSLKILELSGVSGIGVSRETGPDPELPEGAPLPMPELNVGVCLEFAAKYEQSLAEIEKKHGVPRSVILGILLVETALGKNMGRDVAMRALAGMAVTDSPDRLGSAGNSRQTSRIRFGRRLSDTLRQRSERAYGELTALLRWSEKTGLDAARLPGSIYGAVGLCQFMPSNIETYGVDGDQDGKINLFSPVDAMFSAANYLEAHGWRRASSDARRRAVLMAYNDDSLYAAYVLGTAKRMERALAGKLPPQSPAMAGMPASARLDPSLRRLKSVPRSGRLAELGSYKSLLD
ncbi:MAG: lytic murein transglycosylase [Desulfovibrio sp.]|jgi:membrane-bound lytic murein transglycosylase B|nr:lytic murein transglycosylase [Desulfovibrio sp.]